MWNKPDVKPERGRKVIALYSDGSGARMLFVHDKGFIDSDGEESNMKECDLWAYLPDDLEFWCETRADDPVTFFRTNR